MELPWQNCVRMCFRRPLDPKPWKLSLTYFSLKFGSVPEASTHLFRKAPNAHRGLLLHQTPKVSDQVDGHFVCYHQRILKLRNRALRFA